MTEKNSSNQTLESSEQKYLIVFSLCNMRAKLNKRVDTDKHIRVATFYKWTHGTPSRPPLDYHNHHQHNSCVAVYLPPWYILFYEILTERFNNLICNHRYWCCTANDFPLPTPVCMFAIIYTFVVVNWV